MTSRGSEDEVLQDHAREIARRIVCLVVAESSKWVAAGDFATGDIEDRSIWYDAHVNKLTWRIIQLYSPSGAHGT